MQGRSHDQRFTPLFLGAQKTPSKKLVSDSRSQGMVANAFEKSRGRAPRPPIVFASITSFEPASKYTNSNVARPPDIRFYDLFTDKILFVLLKETRTSCLQYLKKKNKKIKINKIKTLKLTTCAFISKVSTIIG